MVVSLAQSVYPALSFVLSISLLSLVKAHDPAHGFIELSNSNIFFYFRFGSSTRSPRPISVVEPSFRTNFNWKPLGECPPAIVSLCIPYYLMREHLFN